MTHDQIDMINRCMEVIGTVEEALERADYLFAGGNAGGAFVMINDAVTGLMSVSAALGVLEDEETPADDLQSLQYDMENSFGILADAFEDDDAAVASEALRTRTIPSFKEWKAEVEKRYGKITLN